MTTILHAIQDAASDTVEVSGMFWRVNKVSSSDLARVGFAALAMATPAEDEDAAPAEADDIASRMTPK